MMISRSNQRKKKAIMFWCSTIVRQEKASGVKGRAQRSPLASTLCVTQRVLAVKQAQQSFGFKVLQTKRSEEK